MVYKREEGREVLQDRLAALDHRIARMRALNASQGDVLALRLVEYAEIERKEILAAMPEPVVKPERRAKPTLSTPAGA